MDREDIKESIEVLQQLNIKLKSQHMVKDMDDGNTIDEIKLYRARFKSINIAIKLMKKQLQGEPDEN